MSQKTKIEALVDAFQDLADWLDASGKWKAIKAILLIISMAAVILTAFYGYKKINTMGNKIDDLNPSPEMMQELLEETGAQNKIISQVLREDMLNVGGDRAYLIRFHNGQRDINGTHFMYMSMSNEVLSEEIGSGFANWQDVPTSQIPPEWLDNLLVGKCFAVIVDELEGYDAIKKRVLSSGAKRLLICPINDISNGNLLGVLGMTWVTELPCEGECLGTQDGIKTASSKLSAVLSINN